MYTKCCPVESRTSRPCGYLANTSASPLASWSCVARTAQLSWSTAAGALGEGDGAAHGNVDGAAAGGPPSSPAGDDDSGVRVPPLSMPAALPSATAGLPGPLWGVRGSGSGSCCCSGRGVDCCCCCSGRGVDCCCCCSGRGVDCGGGCGDQPAGGNAGATPANPRTNKGGDADDAAATAAAAAWAALTATIAMACACCATPSCTVPACTHALTYAMSCCATSRGTSAPV